MVIGGWISPTVSLGCLSRKFPLNLLVVPSDPAALRRSHFYNLQGIWHTLPLSVIYGGKAAFLPNVFTALTNRKTVVCLARRSMAASS